MKRTISLILMLYFSLFPFIVYGESSPTLESLWHTEPELQIELITDIDEFGEYLELISTYYDLEHFSEMMLQTTDFHIVDMLIVTLGQSYEDITWYTPYEFTPNDTVCIFMIAVNLQQGYVITVNGGENGELVINYEEVSPNTYFMIIYAAD